MARVTCQVRISLAWTFNLVLLVFFLFVSMIYGLKFEEQATNNMVLTWLMAYGLTFAIIEPAQVILLVCCPCLWNENHRCGRCMVNCRFMYNEICAP